MKLNPAWLSSPMRRMVLTLGLLLSVIGKPLCAEPVLINTSLDFQLQAQWFAVSSVKKPTVLALHGCGGLYTADGKTLQTRYREYVQRLLDDSRMRVVKGCAIHSVSRSKSGVEVRGAQGYAEEFDHVVLATHADTALAMLEAPGGAEARLLSTFKYSQNLATLHRDPRFMPRRRRMWSSWNCVSDGDVIGNQASVTYWMNALQPLPTATNLFVSINARAAPEPQFIEQEIKYAHPIFTTQTRKAQTELWSLQGQNRTWYCGAHFGAGFHEDGLQAGLAVAEQLGGLVRPWTVAGKSDRIFVPDLEATG